MNKPRGKRQPTRKQVKRAVEAYWNKAKQVNPVAQSIRKYKGALDRLKEDGD